MGAENILDKTIESAVKLGSNGVDVIVNSTVSLTVDGAKLISSAPDLIIKFFKGFF